MKKVSILGLGAMGQRMAARLLDANFIVSVYNRSPFRSNLLVEAGAHVADTAADAVSNADFVINMLTDDNAVGEVWCTNSNAALDALQVNTVVIQTSTLSLAYSHSFAEQILATGAEFIDAPVVGSRPQAESGQLIFLAAGKEKTIANARPLLEALGSVIEISTICGTATIIKHAANAYFGIQVAALAELVGMLQKSNIPLAQATEVMSALPITSPTLQFMLKQIATQAYNPLFPIDLVAKDFTYALETAENCSTDLSITSATENLFRLAAKQGYGSENISAVAKLFID